MCRLAGGSVGTALGGSFGIGGAGELAEAVGMGVAAGDAGSARLEVGVVSSGAASGGMALAGERGVEGGLGGADPAGGRWGVEIKATVSLMLKWISNEHTANSTRRKFMLGGGVYIGKTKTPKDSEMIVCGILAVESKEGHVVMDGG